MVSIFGSGILVGTALVVIVPEGVETVYSALSKSDDSSSPRGAIGIALLSGFMLMYIIDKAPKIMGQRGGSEPTSIDVMEMRFRRVAQEDAETGLEETQPGGHSSETKRLADQHATSTSIGLWIHAIADGIALGASISSDNAALGLFVFVAILIHKAPAAFGLSSVLQDCGVSSWHVKRDLAIFAACAPVGAIITYTMVWLLGSNEPISVQWWAGVLLVFSGGTFLFVAMHVMEHLAGEDSNLDEPTANALLTSAGMMVPLISLLVPDI
jgi:zinc transporter 9